MAEPSSSVLAKLRPGQEMPMVVPSKAVANSAGIVNLIEAPDYCVGAFYKNLGKKLTYVGATYATVNRITMHFSYTEGASSSLEVGFSASGKQGTFHGNGSISQSTTFEQDMPATTNASKNWWRTYFRYGEYILVCSGIGDQYWTQAYQWDAGDAVTHPRFFPRTPGFDCVGELSGSAIKDDRTKAASFAAGFTLGAPIGFTGSAQTGWTHDAQIDYKWHVNGSACGTNNEPPYAAAIVAK
jgi:hypothetical protein